MVEEMVALAMVVAPRGLACEYRRLAMSRVLGSRMPLALLKGTPRAAPLGASRRSFTGLSGAKLSTKISGQEPWKGHREKSYMRAAAVDEPLELTKKRLTREERTALVRSYVTKFMSENNGEFPTLTAVLKDTGGSRAAVKEILADVESSLKPAEEKATAAAVTEGGAQKTETTVHKQVPSLTAAVSETEEEESEEGESEEEPEASKPEGEKEKVTTLRRMVGETPGEINTYSDILSRLRSLGAESSRKKEDSPSTLQTAEALVEAAATGAPAEKKPSFAARILPPRHGVFVRFLHPSATEEDLRNAFADCGEIVRVSAVKPMKPTAKFTYGFIDFKTADGLSNALRKNVEIRGHKVEMEAAPTQNTQLPDSPPKLKDHPVAGPGVIDNLVSKVVSMSPGDNNQQPQPGKVWNGQDAARFSQLNNKGPPDFKPKLMGFQRNDMQPMPPRNDMPPPPPPAQKLDMPPPTMQRSEPRMGMPQPPRNDNNAPYRVLPPRTENGGFTSPIPPLSDPQKLRKDLAVCVENLPPTTNVTQLRDALSIHGEIYATYLKNREMQASSYYFEYLTEEGKESALSAHWLHLNGQMLRVSRAELPKTTIVRVSNISPSTPDSEFVNACKSCGQVERVESRRDRVRDVFYHPSEARNMIRILDRLNEITYNQCRWHAKPAPRIPLNMLNQPEGPEFICQQMKLLLKNQDSMLQQMQIEQRDLRELSMYAVEMLSSRKKM